MPHAEQATGIREVRARLSLKLKLSLLITGLLVATVVIVTVFFLRQEQHTLTAEMTKRGLTIATNLAASARNSILTDDEASLALLVRQVMHDPDVAYVVMADHRGQIVAHPDLAMIGRPFVRWPGLAPLGELPLVQSYTDPTQGPLIEFAVPLAFSKIPVGAVYLGFSQRPIAEAVARARNQAVLVSSAMVLVGIAGSVGLATLLSRPIRRLVAGTRAIGAGDYRVSLAVTSCDELGVLTESFNQMAESLREKELIKRAFRGYVAREVADEILKNPEHLVLKGERRDVTVLFCDMRGFTSLAERLPPEEVVLLLNQFYTLMIDTTFKYGGSPEKFLGDGIMAIFGAPIPQGDHAAQGVRAALAMRTGVVELSEKRLVDGKAPVTVGIGLSAGEAVAGTVGTQDKMEYTVVGDNVNLAARLESEAKPGQILISRRTYEQVAGEVEARSLGVLRLRGKEEPVEVYEVLGLAPGA